VLKALAAREQQLVQFARDLVAIPSPNPPGDEREIAERARGEMASLRYTGVREVAMEPTRPNVVGEVVGERAGKVLMFNGHIDTKPVGDLSEWTIGPFDPVVRDGRLHGLGSTDMKGAVAAMVHAGAALAEVGAPPGTLRVVLTADEENGSRFGARFLAGRQDFAADAVIVGEPTGMEKPWAYVAVASRGIACFRVVVRGTITDVDTFDVFVRHFAGDAPWLEIEQRLARGDITLREALALEASFVTASLDEADAVLQREVRFDETFGAFVAACEARDISIAVVSSGIEPLIRRALARHGLEHLALIANPVTIRPNGWRIDFRDESDNGNDKAGLVEAARARGEATIYIGASPTDAALAADRRFAKRGRNLERFLQREGVAFEAFSSFAEITSGLATAT